MKSPDFSHINLTKTTAGPRNADEDLIEQIVAACVLKPHQVSDLKRLLAITAKTAKWSTSELHALLQKRHDPSIRNYTAFVWWSAKVTNKRTGD